MANTIQIIEVISETILKEFSIEEFELAQNYASEMDKLGLEIQLKAPSLPETLVSNLGANPSEISSLREMILEEIDSHNEGPCSSEA